MYIHMEIIQTSENSELYLATDDVQLHVLLADLHDYHKLYTLQAS